MLYCDLISGNNFELGHPYPEVPCNIQEDVSKEKKSINLDNVLWELITDHVNINRILKQDDGDSEVTSAKVTELQKLQQFKTYEEVEDCGQHKLSTRWVITKKEGQTKSTTCCKGL